MPTSSNYYAAVILATRDSARALQAIARTSRMIRAYERTGDTAAAAKLYPTLCKAQRRYARAQEILASHRPLTPDDIAARVASYPSAFDRS